MNGIGLFFSEEPILFNRKAETIMILFFLLFLQLGFATGDSPKAPAPARHGLFDAILHDYVKNGRVDYRGLQNDARLDAYLRQLQHTDPDTFQNTRDQLAFWLNAYNAFTLKLIVDNYPLKSINELHFGGLYIGTILKKTIWHKKFIQINGRKLSLNNIEHDILRKQFHDPRIHFAIVCASISCPPLREEPYEGFKVDEQLDDQGRRFFSESDKNRFDVENRIAYLSKILDWFAEDFGRNKAERLRFISRFVAPDIAAALQSAPETWKVRHTAYNWNLNVATGVHQAPH